jgi:hypothetical protein
MTPTNIDYDDATASELGVKFQVAEAGFSTGHMGLANRALLDFHSVFVAPTMLHQIAKSSANGTNDRRCYTYNMFLF